MRRLKLCRTAFATLLVAVIICKVIKGLYHSFKPAEGTTLGIGEETIGKSVPRGQSFFYMSSESQRLGSFETWRPRNLVHRITRPVMDFQDSDNIHLAVHTSLQSMWQNIPMQLLTNLQLFPSFSIYGNIPDSIGGVEVIDVLDPIDEKLRDQIADFEPYVILKSIRNSHVIIPPDQVSMQGVSKLARFQMLPLLLQMYQEHPNREWYVIIDDKATIFADNLRNYLGTLDHRKPYYLGRPVKGREFIFASISSGIILSHGLMQQVFAKEGIEIQIYCDYTKKAKYECCGDYVLAMFLDNFDIHLDLDRSGQFFEADALPNVKVRARNWCSPIFTLGNQRLRDMELTAEYICIKPAVIHSDLYLDFIKPYLTADIQQNWDNGASDMEFGPHHDRSTEAHKSPSDCRRACESVQQCTMFRYDTYTQYCGLGISSVALGGPILQYKESSERAMCEKFGTQCENRKPNQPMTSEWLVDRIRDMRQSLSCDPLYLDTLSEGTEFGSLDQVEGWWYRAMQVSEHVV